VIRTATSDDLDAIMAIENASFPTDAWPESAMAAELESPHGRYVVDEEDGIRGYAGLRHLAGGADSDVQTIAVAAEARGRGIGRGLLRELLETARNRNAREVFLEARRQPGRAGAVRERGLRRDRTTRPLLPARRRRCRDHEV
jgi:ribosomal protein S18 acetylase RimI-like enzyme